MTRRERLEAKLEKRRQWAQARSAKADETLTRAMNVPLPPFGEPIKVGHHSEGRHRAAIARADSLMRSSSEHRDMARHHETKADGLEQQLDNSIFTDDEDAADKLGERIAALKDERERVKRFNASVRKGCPDWDALTPDQVKYAHSLQQLYRKPGVYCFPAFHLSSL